MAAVSSNNTLAFLTFLKSRQTGLIQKSSDWVKARQHTIGASEISALTGSSPFETQESLFRKKLQYSGPLINTACTWGNIFEPLIRKFFEQKHSVTVFGQSISLDLAKDNPLYRKVTCSPDGYFKTSDNTFALLEFKCPFKRKIAINAIPRYYRDQIQTGLALSGDMVPNGLFVDAYFRMCSFDQIGPCQSHNSFLNRTNEYKTKHKTPLAWGVCYVYSKQSLFKTQKNILDLGSPKITKALFEKVMKRIAENKRMVLLW